MLMDVSSYLVVDGSVTFSCFCLLDDYNRVQLTTGNKVTGCDYINASFINVKKYYISCIIYLVYTS